MHTTHDGPLVNHPEAPGFARTALAWSQSASPQILKRVGLAALYSALVTAVHLHVKSLNVAVTPFEYSGVFLGILLVLRINTGLDRWWEARKLWGGIVNHSRNLAINVAAYSDHGAANTILIWIASWPHVMRVALRRSRNLTVLERLLPDAEIQRLEKAQHPVIETGLRVAEELSALRRQGLDPFAFQRAETERAQLIDMYGACERILGTPIPFVLAVKIRRFILLFLGLLPFSLAARAEWLTPVIVSLVAYTLFVLDEIGSQLQNPFSSQSLSHLPLESLCHSIEGNVIALKKDT